MTDEITIPLAIRKICHLCENRLKLGCNVCNWLKGKYPTNYKGKKGHTAKELKSLEEVG